MLIKEESCSIVSLNGSGRGRKSSGRKTEDENRGRTGRYSRPWVKAGGAAQKAACRIGLHTYFGSRYRVDAFQPGLSGLGLGVLLIGEASPPHRDNDELDVTVKIVRESSTQKHMARSTERLD